MVACSAKIIGLEDGQSSMHQQIPLRPFGGSSGSRQQTDPRFREGKSQELSLSAAFSLLADRRRRYVLYHLIETDPDTVPFEEIRDRVLAWERSDGIEAGPDRLSVSLRHQHLPKLDDVGLIDWDPDADRVAYHGQPLVERWLHETKRHDFE